MKKNIHLSVIAALLVATTAMAQSRHRRQLPPELPLKDVFVHDPVMAKEGDTYYLYSTGMGISVMSSKDMKVWKFEKSIFAEPPTWTQEALPGFRGHMWAPDVIYHNGLWHMFYSCSAFEKNTSVIGHATSPTLNPASPEYKWTDQGKIIQSVPNRDMWNAIDSNIIIDEEGTPWMNFGSFWGGIKMVKLTKDMMKIEQPEEWYSLSRRKRTFSIDDTKPGDGAVEAPFIMKHGDYYYLFVSFDYCCRGLKSNYKVAVGRSKNVVGPYLDKEGKRMDKGGGSILISGNKDWAGIGHNSAYNFDNDDYFISHAYDVYNNGISKLIIRKMKWSDDGWPMVEW